MIEQVVKSTEFRTEHKKFHLELRTNGEGSFVRITEIGKTGRTNRIFLPVAGIEDMQKQLGTMVNGR